MPTRPPRHCPPRLLVRDDRPSAAARGYGARWRRLRLWFLRQQPLCAECGRCGRLAPASHVDHVLPRERGGSDDPTNLQSLCASCHSRKTCASDGGFGRAPRL